MPFRFNPLLRSLLCAALLIGSGAVSAQAIVADEVDLIRHGESDDNLDAGQPIVELSGKIVASPGKVLSGWNSVSLTMLGVAQAVQAGQSLKAHESQASVPMREAVWVYSPQLRTQQTLAGVLTGAGLASPAMLLHCQPDTRMQERSAGAVTNMTWEEAATVWDEMKKGRDADIFLHVDAAYPAGESMAMVYRRASASLDEHMLQGRRVIVVSHELTIKALLAHLLRHRIDDSDFATKVENGKPIVLRRTGGEWKVQPG
jgi:broad specificity phosphatase PhoE